jgi:hypothetical protein
MNTLKVILLWKKFYPVAVKIATAAFDGKITREELDAAITAVFGENFVLKLW